MNVASLELCKELYKLSGWGETMDAPSRDDLDWYGENKTYICPKYNLGYLMRKLPHEVDRGHRYGWLAFTKATDFYVASYRGKSDASEYWGGFYWYGDTPEQAATYLAIELFKKGILKKGEH